MVFTDEKEVTPISLFDLLHEFASTKEEREFVPNGAAAAGSTAAESSTVEVHDGTGLVSHKVALREKIESKSAIGKFRETCGFLVDHIYTQSVIAALICINVVMLGLGTYTFITETKANAYFEAVDVGFLVIFTIEQVFQIIYHDIGIFYDGWLTFDFLIVVMSWSFPSLTIIRAFRVFRALRLITKLGSLLKLVTALGDAIPRLFAILTLMVLMLYIFSVLFTNLFGSLHKDGYSDQDYFGRLDYTFYTLFQLITGDWAAAARACQEVYSWAWAPFVIYIFIMSMIFMNLIVAVICDAVGVLNPNAGSEPEYPIQKYGVVKHKIGEVTMKFSLIQENDKKLNDALEKITSQLVPLSRSSSTISLQSSMSSN